MVEYSLLTCIVIAVAQLWKKVGLNTDLIPLLNICVATLLSIIFTADLELLSRIQQGLIIGLAASGTYDLGKCFKKF